MRAHLLKSGVPSHFAMLSASEGESWLLAAVYALESFPQLLGDQIFAPNGGGAPAQLHVHQLAGHRGGAGGGAPAPREGASRRRVRLRVKREDPACSDNVLLEYALPLD